MSFPPHYKLLEWIDMDKIYWWYLSTNPNATQILEQNMNKINWGWLSSNPHAIPILENNLDKIVWWRLSALTCMESCISVSFCSVWP